MITLSRLNGQIVAINPDLITWIDVTPDTTVSLLGGDRIIVRESLEWGLRQLGLEPVAATSDAHFAALTAGSGAGADRHSRCWWVGRMRAIGSGLTCHYACDWVEVKGRAWRAAGEIAIKTITCA